MMMCLGGVVDLPECYRVSTFVLAVFTGGFLLKSTGVLAVLQNPFTCYSMLIFVLAVFTIGVKHVLELSIPKPQKPLHVTPFPDTFPESLLGGVTKHAYILQCVDLCLGRVAKP
jgi:hypothetical protein